MNMKELVSIWNLFYGLQLSKARDMVKRLCEKAVGEGLVSRYHLELTSSDWINPENY